MHSSEVFKFLLLRIIASLLRVVLFGESIIGPTIPGLIQLFGFLGFSMMGMEGVTSNGSTYPSWTGPRADWRAILSSLINARVMDSVGFKPACSCWRHNRQDTTTLATLDTTTMFQLTTLSRFLFGFFDYLRCFFDKLEISLDMRHSQKQMSYQVKVMVTFHLNISYMYNNAMILW